jgi:hypothetical protein
VPYYKFGKNDIFYNQIKAYPKINFVIYSGSVYYNNRVDEAGLGVPKGSISLYELAHNNANIYPFVTKQGSRSAFKTISTNNFNQFKYGDEISGSYPMSASISRDYYSAGNKRLTSLKNTINYYKKNSIHFDFSNSNRDLGSTEVGLISIPSIYYGSSIKKGTVNLKFYITGTLVGQARDERQNGELIQTGPYGSPGSGSVIGITLYNEGFLILTGSTALSSHTEVYAPRAIPSSPSWVDFATTGSALAPAHSSSFSLDFQGTNYIPTVTMMAHAKKGELNHSNNPTYAEFGQVPLAIPSTSSFIFKEYEESTIKNVVQSPYPDPTGSFEKTVYISKIGIYDEQKNLIAIAKLATPVKKTEDREFTFKLKLDI